MDNSSFFTWQRFSRLLLIELETHWKKILMGTGMLYAIGLMIYIDISDNPGGELFDGVFILIAFISSALATSIIFNDLHHPLERYQFLTLPCSQLERYASKYFFTGPLFLFYAFIASLVFKLIAPFLVNSFGGEGAPFRAVYEFPAQAILCVYLSIHAIFLIGAIVFKNYAVVKTALCLFILPYTLFFVSIFSLKVIYFDHYTEFWSMQSSGVVYPGIPVLLIRNGVFIQISWLLMYLWVLYIGYICLKDHEA